METINNITRKFRNTNSKEELIDDSDGDCFLKNASANRKQSDVLFLVTHVLALFILFCLLGYCVFVGNISRITKGSDNCGNVCGEKNFFIIKRRTLCHTEDMTDKPYLKIDDQRTCVTKCEQEGTLHGHQCFLSSEVNSNEKVTYSSFITGFSKDLYLCSYELLSTLIISLVFAVIILQGLRYMVSAFVWSLLIGTCVLSAIMAACMGFTAYLLPPEKKTKLAFARWCAVVFGCVIILIAIFAIVIRKRIPFITQLFREAEKSIAAVPILLFQPVLTVLFVIIVCICWCYFAFWIVSTGSPIEFVDGKVTLEQNGVTLFTFWYSLFMAIWMIQFICCCQDMLISGVISTWYFVSNKNKLGKSTIIKSTNIMIKYHLGTISFSSLTILFAHIFDLLVFSFRRIIRIAECLQVYSYWLTKWNRYYTKDACVITAIYGYGFKQAGSRAFDFIFDNLLSVLSVCSPDHVLSLAKAVVAVGATMLGTLMVWDKPLENFVVIIIVMVIVAYIIAHCVFSVYAITIDTIFVCFCEDCAVNDGINSPYFMSRELMEFVDSTNKYLLDKQEEEENNTTPDAVV